MLLKDVNRPNFYEVLSNYFNKKIRELFYKKNRDVNTLTEIVISFESGKQLGSPSNLSLHRIF